MKTKVPRAVTSSLTPWLTHVVLVNAKARNYSEKNLTGRFRELRFLRIEPLRIRDYEAAAVTLMRRYALDLEDSLHFAVAERLRIDEIYTNDKDFEKTH